MKKKSFILVFLMILCSAFLLVGCGEPGPAGETGPQGPKGEQGEVGPQGPKGDKGDKGDTGAKGDKGEAGAKGDKGDTGAKGQDGKDGTNGTNGTDGKDGREIEFKCFADGIKWRYVGEKDSEWKVLVTFDDIKGYSSKYTITLDSDGGTELAPKKNQVYKSELKLPKPKKEGYKYVGWTDGEKLYTGTYTVMGDATLKAVYSAEVTFDMAGGAQLVPWTNANELAEAFIKDFNATLNVTATADKLYSYAAEVRLNKFLDNPILMAKYRPFMKAILDIRVTEQQSIIDDANAKGKTGASNPDFTANMFKQLDRVNGYNDETARIGIIQEIGAFFAKNQNNYYSQFTFNYGNAEKYAKYEKEILDASYVKVAPMDVLVGETADLGQVAKEGINFMGWFDGETYVGTKLKVTKPVKLVAKWGARVELNVNDDEDNKVKETVTSPVVVTDDKKVTLPALTRDNYTFKGWFDEFGVEVKEVAKTTAAKTLVAKWEAVSYKVHFQGQDNTIEDKAVKYGEKLGELTAGSKEGGVFKGWFTKDGTNGDWGEQLTADTIMKADITAYAKFEISEVVINVTLSEADKAAFAKIATDLAGKEVVLVRSDFTAGKVKIGEDVYPCGAKAFATVTDALAKPDLAEGAVIYVFAGTYEGNLTINKPVTLAAPNYGVLGNATRTDEAAFTGRIEIKASNVHINGIKVTGGDPASKFSPMAFGNVSNCSIKNCYLDQKYTGASDAVYYGNNRRPFINQLAGANCDNIVIDGNLFDVPDAWLKKGVTFNDCVNVAITNNTFLHFSTGGNNFEAFYIYRCSGKITFTGNTEGVPYHDIAGKVVTK